MPLILSAFNSINDTSQSSSNAVTFGCWYDMSFLNLKVENSHDTQLFAPAEADSNDIILLVQPSHITHTSKPPQANTPATTAQPRMVSVPVKGATEF